MKNARRLAMMGLLLCGVLALVPNSWAQQRPPILEQIAKTYGLDSYSQIEAIRYTWNGEIPGIFKLSHIWEWEPKTGKVSFEGNDKDGKPVKVTYMRSELSSQPDNVKTAIEPAFVNDNYWLLFPFHAYWDTSATVTDEGMKKLPTGAGSAELVVGEVCARNSAATRPATPGNSTSAKTIASTRSKMYAGGVDGAHPGAHAAHGDDEGIPRAARCPLRRP